MRPAWLLLGAMLLAGCGSNPLLQMAASNYLPLAAGNTWTYSSPNGLTTTVVTVGNPQLQQGHTAFAVSFVVNGGAPTTQYLYDNAGAVDTLDPTLGWIIWRRLPYVTGSVWNVPVSALNVSQTMTVSDTVKAMRVPAGNFGACYKLVAETDTYSGVSIGAGALTTTYAYTWAAPNVGDIQHDSVDASGNETIVDQLVSYHLP